MHKCNSARILGGCRYAFLRIKTTIRSVCQILLFFILIPVDFHTHTHKQLIFSVRLEIEKKNYNNKKITLRGPYKDDGDGGGGARASVRCAAFKVNGLKT